MDDEPIVDIVAEYEANEAYTISSIRNWRPF